MRVQIALLLVVIGAISAKPKYVPWFISKPPKIVGGVEATQHEFPWIVDMRQGSHYCGGSIYNNEWVVTAAHCSLNSPSAYTLTAGDHDISGGNTTEQKRQVVTIIRHPNYGAGVQYSNDIALMQISPPYVFNEYVQPIALPPNGYSPTEKAIVAGWGALTEGGSSPTKLMKVEVPVVSDTACRLAYGESRIIDSMICSGEAGKDSCQGDSGGPMTCHGEGVPPVLCGVVSWGSGCARPGFPGVYTEVSYFGDWIESAIVPPPEDNSTWVEQSKGCGGVLEGTSGRLSYKLNEDYNDNERCVWTIRSTTRSSIRLNLLESGLSNGSSLTVTQLFSDDGSTSVTAAIDKDQEVIAAGSVIIITFRANGTGQGFLLEFYGTGFGGAPDTNFNHIHLTGATGSLNYPASGYYNPNEYVTIAINPEGSNPTVRIDKLDIENAGNCQYDSLNVLNFNNDNYVYSGKYCAPPLPAPFVALDGLIIFIFKTDDSVQQTGFSISWVSG